MQVERLEIKNPENFKSHISNLTVVDESSEVPLLFQESKYEYSFKLKELSNFTFIKELLIFWGGLNILFKNCTKLDEEGNFKCEKSLYLDFLTKEVPSHDNRIEV